MSPDGNAVRSMRVTMPKLLEAPLSACHKSELVWLMASTILPLASTTSKFSTLSQTKPYRAAKKELPPVADISLRTP